MPGSFALFQRHLIDLRQVCPDANEVFVCPICFRVISKETVNEQTVDLGHVWPRYIRDVSSSDAAKHQQVLLCKSCNSNAGSHGDNEMQDLARALRGEKLAKIWVFPPNRQEPFWFRAYFEPPVSPDSEISRINFPQMPRSVWGYNKELQKYRELAGSGTRCDIAVVPYDVNWDLAFAGWLTSAYLFAFYIFGYRYIFHSKLDSVRHYIKQSFGDDVDSRLIHEEQKDTSVRICKTGDHWVPQISYVMQKLGNDVPHHLEISFLNVHVRLPIPLKYSIGIPVEFLPMPEMFPARDASHYTAFHNPCPWTDILAEPEYSVNGKQLL